MSKVCKQCQTKFEDNTKFCSQCGAHQEGGERKFLPNNAEFVPTIEISRESSMVVVY